VAGAAVGAWRSFLDCSTSMGCKVDKQQVKQRGLLQYPVLTDVTLAVCRCEAGVMQCQMPAGVCCRCTVDSGARPLAALKPCRDT
jgi:hypothetical protein